jgi:hypothetical protein
MGHPLFVVMSGVLIGRDFIGCRETHKVPKGRLNLAQDVILGS